MHTLLITFELQIPHARSLKQKRGQLRSLIERIRNRFNASVAEIDALDNWQHAVVAACMISNDRSYLDKQYSLLETLILEQTEIVLLNMNRQWL